MKKILIIEDDPNELILLKKQFDSDEYEVITANNPEDATRLAEEVAPDLILLDLILGTAGPHDPSDGFRVLDIIRHSPDIADTPVLIMTQLSAETYQEKAVSLGADRFIEKSDHLPSEIADEAEDLLTHPAS